MGISKLHSGSKDLNSWEEFVEEQLTTFRAGGIAQWGTVMGIESHGDPR